MAADAATFGKGGVTLKTTPLDAPVECGGICKSAHLVFNHEFVHGTIKVVGRWFPGSVEQVSTATGFIGLDSEGNKASITMGFHGAGWSGDDAFGSKFQTALYASVSDPHLREYTSVAPASVAEEFHEYEVEWTKQHVVWRFDGKVVRKVTNKGNIPTIAMKPRLHTRSGYCDLMPAGGSLVANIKSFEFTAVVEDE